MQRIRLGAEKKNLYGTAIKLDIGGRVVDIRE